jgi:hypothetical protein
MRYSLVVLLSLCLFLPAVGQERAYPFSVDQDHLAGAPDFSYLNHPLGSGDRVFVKDGHFYTVGKDLKPGTADDQRVRFFGVNTAFGANFPEAQDAVRIAKRLRRLGINLVRLHHMDSSPDRDPNDARSLLTTGPYPSLNPVSVARLRGFLDALKSEGIYVNLNLHVGYEFRPAVDQVPAIPGADRLPAQSKPLHIFYPRMQDLQVEYTRKVIEALKLKNDAVLAMVEIDNETSLLDAWQRNQIERLVTGDYREELERQKRAFLRDQADSVDSTILFFVERDRAYLKRMLGAVRESTDALVPVAGTQVGYGGLLNYDSHQDLDYQDNHFYIDHYNFPNRAWDGRDWRQRNTTATGTGLAPYLNMAATREAGRPFTVSEFNQPYPNTYAAEIDPTLAAFAAFQDWDGLMHFAYEHGREWDRGGPDGFNLNGDWTKWPGVGQSAWMFRTGAVGAARETVSIPVPYEARLEAARQKTNGNAVRFLKSSAGYDANVALVHRVELAPGKSGTLPESAKPGATPFQSDTGELSFDAGRRVFVVDAAQAVGVFGFAGDAPVTAGSVVLQLAAGSRGFVSFLLTALDAKPLHRSSRMLLTVPGYTVFPGQKLVNYPGSTDWWTLTPAPGSDRPSGAYVGNGPVMMERTECVMRLRTEVKSLAVYPLDGCGGRMSRLDRKEVTRENGVLRLHLAADTPWYEIAAK